MGNLGGYACFSLDSLEAEANSRLKQTPKRVGESFSGTTVVSRILRHAGALLSSRFLPMQSL